MSEPSEVLLWGLAGVVVLAVSYSQVLAGHLRREERPFAISSALDRALTYLQPVGMLLLAWGLGLVFGHWVFWGVLAVLVVCAVATVLAKNRLIWIGVLMLVLFVIEALAWMAVLVMYGVAWVSRLG